MKIFLVCFAILACNQFFVAHGTNEGCEVTDAALAELSDLRAIVEQLTNLVETLTGGPIPDLASVSLPPPPNDTLINPLLRVTWKRVTLSWTPPEGVVGYIAKLIPAEGLTVTTRLSPLDTFFIPPGIELNTNYSIEITPIMGDGPGKPYNSIFFTPRCPELGCPLGMNPICGSDGVTYSSRCAFEKVQCLSNDESLVIAHLQACEDVVEIADELEEVTLRFTWKEATVTWTALEGVVGYIANLSEVDGDETSVRLSAFATSFTTTDILKNHQYIIEITPIMGDGPGQTYTSEIFIPVCPRFCTFEYSPRCGTDGNTYSNKCALEVAQCETEDVTLVLDYLGPCDPCRAVQCSRPMCQPGYDVGAIEGECCDGCVRQVFEDCSDAMPQVNSTNGLYLLQPRNVNTPFEAYCDFAGDGAWTVILRRVNSTETFLRGYEDYVEGFGNASGAHWIGLEKIYWLNKNGNTRLHISATDDLGDSAFAHYNIFRVGSAETNYTLQTIIGYRGNLGNALAFNKGVPFSAPDSGPARGCANRLGGAWWYKGNICTRANPLGEYLDDPEDFAFEKGIFWAPFKGKGKSMMFMEFKIRTV